MNIQIRELDNFGGEVWKVAELVNHKLLLKMEVKFLDAPIVGDATPEGCAIKVIEDEVKRLGWDDLGD